MATGAPGAEGTRHRSRAGTTETCSGAGGPGRRFPSPARSSPGSAVVIDHLPRSPSRGLGIFEDAEIPGEAMDSPGAPLAGLGAVRPRVPARRVEVCEILGARLFDGLLGHVLPIPEVGSVGQGVAIRAQRDEVVGAVGAPLAARDVVVDLKVSGAVAQGAAEAVPLVYGAAFLVGELGC